MKDMKYLPYIAITVIAALALFARYADFASIGGIQAMKKDQEHFAKRVEELNDEKIKLEADILIIQNDEKTWAGKEANYQTRIDAKKGILQRLNNAEINLNGVNKEIEKANETLDKHGRDIKRKNKLAAGIGDLDNQVNGLKDAKTDLNKKIDDINEEIGNLTKTRTEQLNQQSNLHRLINGLQLKHTEYQEEEKNLQTWQDAVNEEKDKFERIKNNTLNKKNEFNGLKEEVNKLKDETASLGAKKLKLEEIETAIREKKAAETEKKDLEGEISELKRKAGGLRLSVARLEQAEITAQKNQTVLDNFRSDEQVLKDRKQKLITEVTAARNQKVGLESEIRGLSAEEILYKDKKKSHEKFNKSIQDLKEEKNDLQKQIDDKTFELNGLQSAVEKQEKDKVLQDTGEAIQQLIQGLTEFTEQLRKQTEAAATQKVPPAKNPADPDEEGPGSESEGGN